ncbi:MAG: hypothetical protein IJQ02_01940 [Oscillospiraceae bacterium]|nr:hypothetical protein [Oscillospiraceae bacterium]
MKKNAKQNSENGRKTLCLLLMILILLSLLTACGGQQGTAAEPEAPVAETAEEQKPVVQSPPSESPTPMPSPEIAVDFKIGDQQVTKETSEIDLSQVTEIELKRFLEFLPYLEGLETLLLGKDTAENPRISWETVWEIESARPDVRLQYTFTVHGYPFDLQGNILNLNHIRFEDKGALAYQMARCMPNLQILDMDSCGVADEDMARIRDQLPNVNVIWRVFFGRAYSARTDVERLMISNPVKSGVYDLYDEQLKGLYYCTKVKYLDLGHLAFIKDVGYVANMPDLEVLIIAMTAIKNADALASCHKLNYLEFQTSAACDLSALKDLTALRDLNIAYNFALHDMSPIMDLELDRLYIGKFTPIPREQIEEYKARHPNCIVNTTTEDPTEEGWRTMKGGVAPRYEQLRKEFQYGTNPRCYAYNENDRRYRYRFEY